MNSANRFAHIDGLRALAVLLVVVAHAGAGAIVPGGSGVTIFFTISGFIITHLLLRERIRSDRFDIGRFYFRRVVKIFPPFALAVILPTLIWAIWNPVAWGKFCAQVFFVFNWVKINGDSGVFPGSGVVWSLSIEEQFYIVFALIWLFLAKVSWWRAATVTLATLIIAWSFTARILLAPLPDITSRIYYGTDTRMDSIALGVLVAILLNSWSSGRQPWFTRLLGSDWVIAAAVLLYLASLVIRDPWFRDTFRYTFQSVAAAILILAPFMPGRGMIRMAFTKVSAWRPVATIGLASYSIYLVHLSLKILIASTLPSLPAMVSILLYSTLGVAAGVAMYKWVEVPILNWRIKWEGSRMSALERKGLDTGL